MGCRPQPVVCRPPDCHFCGWKLEAVKLAGGNPPAHYVQVITRRARPRRGIILFKTGSPMTTAIGLPVLSEGDCGPLCALADARKSTASAALSLTDVPRLCVYCAGQEVSFWKCSFRKNEFTLFRTCGRETMLSIFADRQRSRQSRLAVRRIV